MNNLLSILIVNYKSAGILEDCLRSIAEQGVDTEVIIVDNDSGDDERDALGSMSKNFPFIRVILNRENNGYSKANNQALAQSNGDFVLFLNPDTFLFPSCLASLISFLGKTPGAGCVIPKLWMDKRKTFLLPPSSLPTLSEKVRDRLSSSSGLLLRIFRRKWLSSALIFWNSDVPLAMDAISGAFFMTTRSVLDAVGSFDERFPLYFEDSDLCRRMGRAGLTLWYYPRAEAVHYYNQSAKGSPESAQKFVTSERLYFEKHYRSSVLKSLSLLNILPVPAMRDPESVLDFSSPIETGPADYLIFSPLRTMMPCAAHFLTAERFLFDADFVGRLTAGFYHAMLVSHYGKIYKTLVLEKH